MDLTSRVLVAATALVMAAVLLVPAVEARSYNIASCAISTRLRKDETCRGLAWRCAVNHWRTMYLNNQEPLPALKCTWNKRRNRFQVSGKKPGDWICCIPAAMGMPANATDPLPGVPVPPTPTCDTVTTVSALDVCSTPGRNCRRGGTPATFQQMVAANPGLKCVGNKLSVPQGTKLCCPPVGEVPDDFEMDFDISRRLL